MYFRKQKSVDTWNHWPRDGLGLMPGVDARYKEIGVTVAAEAPDNRKSPGHPWKPRLTIKVPLLGFDLTI